MNVGIKINETHFPSMDDEASKREEGAREEGREVSQIFYFSGDIKFSLLSAIFVLHDECDEFSECNA
jgi:hypothetical protein